MAFAATTEVSSSMRKSASITIVEEPAEDSNMEGAANSLATKTMNNGGVVITEPPRRDYYDQGSTEDVADTPLVINRLEAVSKEHGVCVVCDFSIFHSNGSPHSFLSFIVYRDDVLPKTPLVWWFVW